MSCSALFGNGLGAIIILTLVDATLQRCYPWSMPKRSRKPRDVNRLAATIAAEATGQKPEEPPSDKNPHAVALGRLGGLKGGRARAAKLDPEERRRIARKAAEARWKVK